MKKLILLSLCVLMLGLTQVFAQSTITGTVIGKDDGLPLPGVSVKIKGSTTGTQTNANGHFAISAAPGSTLVFTFIGFTTQERAISASTTLNVTLEPSSKELTEVVVVGYGSGTKAAAVGGAISTVTASELRDRPSPNVLDALAGKVAGLNILSSSGEPSSTPSISLHGIGSLTTDGTPLIVLDGIPVDLGTLITLNQNDIESVSVFKDASSTSIYGSRAANGVIYVTSKKGALNRPATVTVSSQYGVSNLGENKFFNQFMNSAQFEAFQVASGQLTQDQLNQTLANLPVKNADTKWYKVYYKSNTPFFQENVSISGGGDKTTYYVSGGYLNDDGIAYRSGYKRYTLRSNVNSVVNKWLQFGLNMSMAYDQRETNPSGSNSTNLGLAMLAAPYYSAVDPNGKPYVSIPGWAHYSPSYRASVFLDPNNNTQFNPTGYVQITPIKGLIIKSQAGMDSYDYRETTTQLPSYLGSPGNGNVEEFFTRGVSKTFTNTAEYKFNVQSVNHFTLLAGQEYTDGSVAGFNGYASGQSDDRLILLGSGPNNQSVGSSATDYVFNSLFGRVDYDYKDKYYAEASIRSDKSSRFGIDHRQGTFWSAGFTWKAKQEDFLKDVSWIDDLALKVSTGTSGNSNIGNYQSLSTLGSVAYGDGSARTSSGFNINAPGNPLLGWESQRLTTFGATVSFFDRIRLDVSYYIRSTSNMLIDVPYPYTSGFSDVTSNTGTLQNKGVDINLEADVWKDRSHGGYFTPFIVANINHDKVTSLFQGRDFWVVPNTGVSWVVGQQVSFFYPIYKGVDPQTGAPQWYQPYPGENGSTKTRKDASAVTSDFDSNALQQNTGVSQYPWLTGSFGFKAGYAGIFAEARFNFELGKHLIDNDRYFYENPNIFTGYNQTKRVQDYWKKPGDVTLFPDVNNYQFTQFDSSLIENASFMRLKELMLGYKLPQSLLGHTKVIKGLSLYVIGRNLFTVTKYLGPDPEVDSNLALGNYPNTKQYSIGLDITL